MSPSPSWTRAFRACLDLELASCLSPRGLRRWLWHILAAFVLTFLALKDEGPGAAEGWILGFFLMIFFSANCLHAGTALVRDEAEGGTLGYSLTRPLRRSHWLAARLAALGIRLLVQGWVTALGLLGIAAYLGADHPASLLPTLIVAMPCAAAAWLPMGALFGLLLRRHQILTLTWIFVVEMGLGQMEGSVGMASVSRHLSALLPASAQMDETFPGCADEGKVMAFLWLAGISLVFTLLAGRIFSRKDWASGSSPL